MPAPPISEERLKETIELVDKHKGSTRKVAQELNISEGAETSTITLNIESRLVSFDLPLNRMLTLEDQQVDYSSDLGFEFISNLQDKEIIWGKKTQ